MSGIEDYIIAPRKKGDFEHDFQYPFVSLYRGEMKRSIVGACLCSYTKDCPEVYLYVSCSTNHNEIGCSEVVADVYKHPPF